MDTDLCSNQQDLYSSRKISLGKNLNIPNKPYYSFLTPGSETDVQSGSETLWVGRKLCTGVREFMYSVERFRLVSFYQLRGVNMEGSRPKALFVNQHIKLYKKNSAG